MIYLGNSPTQPSRTVPQRVVGYYRGPPSPARSFEDIFGTRPAAQDSWTTTGFTPSQADYDRIHSESRPGRADTEADDKYNAAREASNAVQMTPVGLDFNTRWDPDQPRLLYNTTPSRTGAAETQQPSSPTQPVRVNLNRSRRRCTMTCHKHLTPLQTLIPLVTLLRRRTSTRPRRR